MASILEFYIEKEKRELINTISSAKYVSEEQKETMIAVMLKEEVEVKEVVGGGPMSPDRAAMWKARDAQADRDEKKQTINRTAAQRYYDKHGRSPSNLWGVKDGKVYPKRKEEVEMDEDIDDMKDDLRDLQNKLRDKASYQHSQVGWKEDEYEALEDRIEKKKAAIKDVESRTRTVDKHGSTLTKGRG